MCLSESKLWNGSQCVPECDDQRGAADCIAKGYPAMFVCSVDGRCVP